MSIFDEIHLIGVNENTMTNNDAKDIIIQALKGSNNSNIDELIKVITEALDIKEKLENNSGDISDGYHTFNELYHHRAILFSVICNKHPELAWKSKQHDDPTKRMYDGMFIVGIQTPLGQATYHYDIDPYWDKFNVKELERAPKWDGHTPEQAIRRIESLND